MRLQINGENKEVPQLESVADLVEHLGMKADRLAVELNREIVSRERWSSTPLKEGDSIEIVHFVGGGNRD